MEIEKKYYSIGEVADLFGVSTSLIRFWESQFDNIKPKKNKGGARRYTKEDLEQIKLIYKLVKEKGYTLQGAKEALEQRPQVTTRLQAIEHLKEIRGFLQNLKETIGSAPEAP
jgi:DNA-binding transcriptional MerR regulator